MLTSGCEREFLILRDFGTIKIAGSVEPDEIEIARAGAACGGFKQISKTEKHRQVYTVIINSALVR